MRAKSEVHSSRTGRFGAAIAGGLIFLVIVLSAATLHSAGKVKKHASQEAFTAYLDDRIPDLMKRYAVPGVTIALIQKGRTTWSGAYGSADLERGRAMTPDTYCRVESISKSVTAWGVMRLVEQGRVELDKPVQGYIRNWKFPQSKFRPEKITVRQLLSNSAGMPLGDIFERYPPGAEMPSLEESLSKQAVLFQQPGSSFSYSNVGFDLLELLIEAVTGRDFAEYMEKEVLLPLGMHHSSFVWSEKLNPAVPVGYDLKGNSVPLYIYPEKASGGLLASVEDIATFVAAGMTDFSPKGSPVLNSQSVKELYTPTINVPGLYGLAFPSYGLGHFVERLPNGKRAVSHGGQGGGCMTHFYSVPETGDGIVIMANSQRSWPLFAYILSDWAAWRGFGSVGMGRIVQAEKALWVLIVLIGLSVLWQVWRLEQGLLSGRRRLAPLSKEFRLLRLTQGGLSLILTAILLWCVSQDYLDITSLFPIASGWLGIAALGGAVALLLSALLPCTKAMTERSDRTY